MKIRTCKAPSIRSQRNPVTFANLIQQSGPTRYRNPLTVANLIQQHEQKIRSHIYKHHSKHTQDMYLSQVI